MISGDTKKSLTLVASEKFGRYSVNEFIKKCLSLSLSSSDFFFDMLTNVLDEFYNGYSTNLGCLPDIRELKR